MSEGKGRRGGGREENLFLLTHKSIHYHCAAFAFTL